MALAKMGLADTARANEYDVGAFTDEVESCGTFHDIAVNRLRTGEVIDVEASDWEYPSAFDRDAGALFQMHPQLVTHEMVQDA